MTEILKCSFLKEIRDLEDGIRPFESTTIRYMIFLLYLSSKSEELSWELEELNEVDYIYKKLIDSIWQEVMEAFWIY